MRMGPDVCHAWGTHQVTIILDLVSCRRVLSG